MAPNLCRCGTHMRILRAVRRAADALHAAATDASDERATAPRSPSRRALRRWPAARWSSASRSSRARSRAQPPGAGKPAPSCPAASKNAPLLDALDPHRRRRQRHRLHRQGRARPGHQDRADPGRRRGAGRSRPTRITLVTADTARTPNEGYTAGSHSMQDSGTAIRNAAAQVRAILLGVAATRLRRRRRTRLHGRRRRRRAPTTAARVGYGELVAGETAARATPQPQSRRCATRRSTRSIGKPLPRVDIPAKVTGGAAYVQDLRLPGMVHARVVRPPSPARDAARASTPARSRRMPGVLKVVRDGSFLAVVAEREYQAVHGACARSPRPRAGTSSRRCRRTATCTQRCWRRRRRTSVILEQRHARRAPAARTLAATYPRPYQMHGVDRPVVRGRAARRRHATRCGRTRQGVYPAARRARRAAAACRSERVRCIHVEGSGCYGHNGADDVAADAALLARALPGRPVRVQWMREDEHAWEPYGPAMVDERARDARRRAAASPTGSTRSGATRTRRGPARPATCSPARHLAHAVHAAAAASRCRSPKAAATATRSRSTRCRTRASCTTSLPAMPLRVSALRSLGAYMNVFSIESFMDELARAAGADPVAFRLRHLDDPRAQRRDPRSPPSASAGPAIAARAGPRPRLRLRALQEPRRPMRRSRCEVEVRARDRPRARRCASVAAVDSGEVVNPDGIRNQIEGGIVQSASWTLLEEVTLRPHAHHQPRLGRLSDPALPAACPSASTCT